MKLLTLALASFTLACGAAETPYDEAADAKLEIKQALTQATNSNTSVILVFGANWCGDCKMLDAAIKKEPTASLLSKDFRIVKVNVGRMDKNLEIAKSYQVPLDKGIPAVAIVSSTNEVLYVTRAGEVADARKMGETGLYDFFKQATASTKAKK